MDQRDTMICNKLKQNLFQGDKTPWASPIVVGQALWGEIGYHWGRPESCHQRKYTQPLALKGTPLRAKSWLSRSAARRSQLRERKHTPIPPHEQGGVVYQMKRRPGLTLNPELSLSLFWTHFQLLPLRRAHLLRQEITLVIDVWQMQCSPA